MMLKEIENATAEQLANELAAAGEYTEDWERCGLGELQQRVRRLIATYAPHAEPSFVEQIAATTEFRRESDSDWEPLADAPPPVQDAVTNEVCEALCRDIRHEVPSCNTDEAGTVSVGGVEWEYRR